MPSSPRGRLLVFEQNLQEVHPRRPDGIYRNRPDLTRSRELKNFARRLTGILHHTPDAVLLQEVNKRAALKTARQLTRKFKTPFRAVLYPRRPLRVRLHVRNGRLTGIDVHKKNTAILINRRTTKFLRGQYLATPQLKKDRNDIIRVIQHQAIALLREKRSRLKASVASIHFNSDNFFASRDLGRHRRRQWTKRVALFLRRRYPGAGIRVIAGEFCTKRCTDYRRERVSCHEAGLWRLITSDFRYVDAVYQANKTSEADLREQAFSRGGKPLRIDYIFARAQVLAASRDISYTADKGDRNYVADHRGNWALLRKRR